MKIQNHWQGVSVQHYYCGGTFLLDTEDIMNGKMFTESDAMLRTLKNGVGTVLYTFCPICNNRVTIDPSDIPKFYWGKATVQS